MNILIVEDEALLGMWLKIVLTKRGFGVSGIFTNGEDAVEFAKKTLPDVVLMDIRLAGKIDGIQAATEILARGQTSVIFMTGYSDEETRKRASAVAPAAYLVKPFTTADLIDTLSLVSSPKTARA